jgi:hypothetical protein
VPGAADCAEVHSGGGRGRGCRSGRMGGSRMKTGGAGGRWGLQRMPGMHRHTLRFRQLQTYLGVKNKYTRQTIKAQPSSNRVLEQAGRVYVRPMRPRGARYLCDVRRRTEGLTHGRNYERLGSHLQHTIHASSSCRVSCRRYDPDRGTAHGSPDHQTSLPCHPCCTPVL